MKHETTTDIAGPSEPASSPLLSEPVQTVDIGLLDQYVSSGPKFDNAWLVKSGVSGQITSLKLVRDFWVIGLSLDHLPEGCEAKEGYTTLGSNQMRDAQFSGALADNLLPIHFSKMIAIAGKGPQPFYKFV